MLSLLVALSIHTSPSPDRYFQEAMNAKEAGDFARAAKLADACIENYPSSAPCLHVGALIYRHLASKNGDVTAVERSDGYLRRFVQVAPRDDKFLPKAKMMLEHKK